MGLTSGTSFDTASGKLMKIDYAGRADSNPVYIGIAAPGTSDDATAGAWLIQKCTYDGSNRLTVRAINRAGSWTNRASLTYA